MAFRLGHQISCNTNKNFFFRNSSATARRYNRSLSRGTEKPENLVENAHHHETETTTTTNNNTSPSGPLFWGNDSSSSTSKPWRSRIQARDYNTELERKIARQTQNLRSAFRRAGSNNYALQPKNLPPMATTHIHVSNKFATLEEIPNRPYGIRLDELQRQAYVKYEKAVRTLGLKRATENRTYRYQLEAAKMSKRSDIYDIVAEIKNREQTKVALAPQLQPKNIKPYGDIIPVYWSTPGMERLKQKPLSISRLSEVIKKTAGNHNTQVRNFSSMQTVSSQVNSNFRSGSVNMSDDHSKSIAESKEFAESRPKNEAASNADEFDQYDYSNIRQPKLQVPGGFIDGKVVLYYSTRGGKGIICSKVLPKNERNVDIPKGSNNQFKPLAEYKADLTKYRRAVITRAGPKVTLQSRELDDNENSESINPGLHEKFSVPWMSWGERVKMKMQERVEDRLQNESTEEEPVAAYQKSKSTSILERKDRRSDLQIRDFSTFSDSRKHKWRYLGSDVEIDEDVSFSLPNHEDFLEGVDWPDIGPTCKSGSKRLDHTSTRLYTTKCHHGVLEPEGTVMVKLPRLPKVNIPEPDKVCPPLPCQDTCRADANLKVVRKHLPALKVKPCSKTCTEPCMLEGEPLARPKKRPSPQKKIVRPCKRDICPERADHGLKVLPKKLPKLIPKPCGRCEDIEMTSPPLPRLKPRPIPPPPKCKEPGPCGMDDPPCRADANLKVVRKKLPNLVPAQCPRLCPPEMMGGPPLMRPKAISTPMMTRPCIPEPYIEPCPPRADHLSGYRVVKRQLPTVLLAEKNNEMSIQEYAIAQIDKQRRNFSSHSKCDMCCFSNRKLQPDLKTIQSEICPTQWEEFRGFLKAGDDGKLEGYDTATETVDTSTGTELRITRKPIGGLKKRDDDIPQKLLKGGYSVSYAAPEKKKYSVSATAFLPHRDFDEPPLPNPDKFTLPKLKRLEKRRGFEVDFPADSVPWKLKSDDCMKQYIEEHPEPPPRMDTIMQYEVTSKTLPVIPRGTCRKLPVRPPRDQEILVPPKKLYEPVQEREECKTVTVCSARADDSLVETPKKLPPPPISECNPVKALPYKQLKKLPRLKFEDADPPRICPVIPTCPLTVRADEGIDFAPRKTLPALKPANCPRAKGFKMAALRPLKRLPPHPFMERMPCIPEPSLCDEPRADVLFNYAVVPKVLPPLLKNDGKRLNVFNPVPCPLNTKRRRFSTYCNRHFSTAHGPISRRFLSTTSIFRAKDCKLKKDLDTKKKCFKTQISPCKPIPADKSCVCPLEHPYPPCTKQKSPYPSFSECKDDDPYLGITECAKNEKHLQPKYPIVGEFLILKPPPPVQGQIDTQLEEECILKKLNVKHEGGITKTCEDFHKPDNPLRAKQLLKDALKQAGCITDDIRCELMEQPRKPMSCDKKDEKPAKPKGEPGTIQCTGPPKAGARKLKVAPCQPYIPKPSPPKKTICEKKVVDCPDPCEEEPKKKSDGTKGPIGKGGGKGGKGGTGGMGGGQIRSVGSSGSSNPTTGSSSLSAAAGQKPYCKFTNVCRKGATGDADDDPCSQFSDKKESKKAASDDPCGGEQKGKKAASHDPCGGQSKAKKAASHDPCGGQSKAKKSASHDPCGGQSKAKKAASHDPCGGQSKAKKAASHDPCGGQSKAKKAASHDPCGGQSKAKEESQGPCGGAKKEAGDPCKAKTAAKKSADNVKKCPIVKFECPPTKSKAEAKKSASKCFDKVKQEKQPKPESADAKSIAIKCAQKKKAKLSKARSPLAIKCRPVKKPPPPKPKMKCLPKAPPVAPRQRSLWDRILDFFRARPGCPPPDQWKKDKLKRDAERAAAAAGYELCEKKKPKKSCTFPPPSKNGGNNTKCGMKVKPCAAKAKPSGGAACKPKATEKSKCAQKAKPPSPPRKIAAKAGSSRCMSSHRRSKSGCARLKMPAGQLPTVESFMPKGVDPRQKYPSSVELPYSNFPESTEKFPKMPMSESMFTKIKPEMEPKHSRPYSTCRWDPLNHNAMYGALGQKLTFSTTPNQFGLCGPFSFKHLSIDGMNANIIENDGGIDLKRTTVRSDDNQGISNTLALPVTSSALYSCPVLKVCKASILSNCVLGMSTNSISQYLEKAGLFQRRDSDPNIATMQQIRHYSSPKDCKIKTAMEEKKCKEFGQQPCCEERSQKVCDNVAVYPPCTPIEAPYPSFSECYSKFKRIPIAECTEQFKRHTKQKYSGETDVSQIQAKAKKNRNRRNYSTMSCQRFFSSCPKNGNSYPMLLPELSEETLRDMEEKELAKKVLHTVKSGMEAIAICGSDVEAQEAYYQLYEELEKLCENDLNKSMNVCEDLDLQPICSRDLFPDTLLTGNSLPMYADDSLHQLMTIDAIKSFCFSIPTMSTTLYEESEQYKTEKLQKQLDELLDYYKAQKI